MSKPPHRARRSPDSAATAAARMADVVTRPLADAFSVCGGANDVFDNLHNYFLESKALMDKELRVLLWKIDADV
jgi:hypothetical protein